MIAFLNIIPLLKKGKVTTPLVSPRKNYNWQYLTWTLVGLGILVRLFHYIDNRSLWLDEIYLSSSLIKMNFRELTAPMLGYEQKAPIGFLWLVRVCVLLFGKSEMALRFFPLLCGIASLIIFVPVTRYFLQPLGVVLAVGMLALAPPLVYHAVEIKQYSTEMLATIVAIYLYTRYHTNLSLKAMVLWGLFGTIIIWCSYSVIFILAGIALGSSLFYLYKRNWIAFFRSLIPFTMWLVSFGVLFFLFSYKQLKSEWLLDWFNQHAAFMPLMPTSLTDLKWFMQVVYRLFDYPLGLLWFSPGIHDNNFLRIIFRLMPIFLFVLVAGLFWFYRQDKKHFWVLALPILLTLLASGLKLYPFYERLLVFLAPVVILFMALGGERLTGLFPARAKWRYVLPIILLAGPLANSMAQVVNPEIMDPDWGVGITRQHHREAFLYINDRYQPGDVVYIYWNDLPPYHFYKSTYNLKYNAIAGRDVRFISKDLPEYFKNLEPDLKPLVGKKRVWLVYDRILLVNIGDFLKKPDWYYEASAKLQGKMLIHNQFSAMGEEVDSYQTQYTQISLFDLSNK